MILVRLCCRRLQHRYPLLKFRISVSVMLTYVCATVKRGSATIKRGYARGGENFRVFSSSKIEVAEVNVLQKKIKFWCTYLPAHPFILQRKSFTPWKICGIFLANQLFILNPIKMLEIFPRIANIILLTGKKISVSFIEIHPK